MAFNILDIMNAATKAEAGQNRDYQDIVVNYRDIVVTKHNKYSMDELQEIATGIEMDGLQQPLVLGRVNGEYWLVSGHRRLGGIKILVAEGKAGFENVKCRYKDMTEIEFRIALLVGNTFNRKMTDYDLMTQAAEWKEVLTQARKEGLLILEAGERVRDYVAAVMGKRCRRYGPLTPFTTMPRRKSKSSLKTETWGLRRPWKRQKRTRAPKRRLPRRQRTRAEWEPRK